MFGTLIVKIYLEFNLFTLYINQKKYVTKADCFILLIFLFSEISAGDL